VEITATVVDVEHSVEAVAAAMAAMETEEAASTTTIVVVAMVGVIDPHARSVANLATVLLIVGIGMRRTMNLKRGWLAPLAHPHME
jgi:hypothetical protein